MFHCWLIPPWQENWPAGARSCVQEYGISRHLPLLALPNSDRPLVAAEAGTASRARAAAQPCHRSETARAAGDTRRAYRIS